MTFGRDHRREVQRLGLGRERHLEHGDLLPGDDHRRPGGLDEKITNVAAPRGTFGAVQNRLEYTLAQPGDVQREPRHPPSPGSATSTWRRDGQLLKLQILQQAGTAMLAQANQSPQGVLSLLR